ncbi:alpha/beta fold hydrolase [Nocardia gipuzkoensis]|uniref:alpha/beta fold hydrolase n=1 Tax=Nocardia gipuzkoensis TaxID=2749991 RepID=UPI00237E316B|nr:alpha/beta fold hydrolase [Nocardia gipuzkoensis]MDE1675307.1 alpha/beta fold hydrolase [Nocardia gipuzkoensis]
MEHSIGFIGPPHKLYYERLVPIGSTTKPPLLMLPGGAHTGACYRVTPDGRPGWADHFVELGFPVYLTDWPGQGRCGYVPSTDIGYEFVTEAFARLVRHIDDERLVVFTHSMTGPVGWKLLEDHENPISMVVGVGPGPPGNIQPVPCSADEDPERASVAGEIVEERDGYLHIRFRGNELIADYAEPAIDMGEYLTKHAIGPSKRFPLNEVSAWSASTTFVSPRIMTERYNWRGTALRIGADADLTGKRVLIVTGAGDVNHSKEQDGGTAGYLSSRGADVDFLWLGDIDIWGNGHMLMLESNSSEIADVIAEYISERTE